MEIAFSIVAGLVLAYLARRQQLARRPDPTPPLIDHVVYAGDPRTERQVRLETPPGQTYRLLQGQFLRLHWQVLHADQIRISGIGRVEAIGSQDFLPQKDTPIRIEAANGYADQQETIRVQYLEVPQPGIRLIPFGALPVPPNFPGQGIAGIGPVLPLPFFPISN